MSNCFDRGCNGCDNCIDPESQAPEGGPDLRAAAQQAADALEKIARHFGLLRLGVSTLADSTARSEAHAAIEALRAALAAQPQAPVALTDEQILNALRSITNEPQVRLPPGWVNFARAIERAHGIQTKEPTNDR